MGTSRSGEVNSLEVLQSFLSDRYNVFELGQVGPPRESNLSLRLEVAVAAFGEVGVVSVQGSALTMALNPLQPLCMLALPSSGWGRYQMEDYIIDNTVGQSVAFIPARGWRLTNDATGGTSVQFQEQSLIRRMRAISSDLNLADAASLLAAPFIIPTTDPLIQSHYRALLGALQIVDASYRYDSQPPSPMLRLDDLILRCVALLVSPSLSLTDKRFSERLSRHELHRTVEDLMEWMLANLHTPISLSDIEERAHYGRRAVQQGFKAKVGCGPMQWLRKQRLQFACKQLENGEPGLTVSQVAKSCGYLNLASFSRDFHECFHISASKMLRQSRRGIKP
jgi:AraC-like DNA-binding protein